MRAIESGAAAAWVLAHEALSRLAKERAKADFEEGKWLLAALREAVHVQLGFGSFSEYVGRLFGYTPRWVQEKLRVAEALEELPKTNEALATGSANWSVVRELTRVATPETEAEWLDAAKNRTARQVEALVAGQRPGDTPSSPSRPELRKHVLRFEVSPETLATFREAMRKLRRGSPVSLDDDSALLAMARVVLGGPTDAGRASYQIAMTVCEHCGSGQQQACGELVEVGREVVEMAECDAQHIGDPHDTHVGGERPARAKQSIPPRIRRQVNLVVLCGAHHRALHEGKLAIEGGASTGLVFKHADGTTYGQAPSPQIQGEKSKLFAALRGMGFGESETRRAIEKVRAIDLKAQLREALAVLTGHA